MPSISPQRRHGKIVGYSVYLGSVGNERRARRFFPQRRAAERFLAQQTTTPVPVGELWERKAEILYSLERLRPIGTNLADVVSFYLSHQNITDGQKMVGEVLEEFLREKLQVGRSRNYERNMRKTFTKFLRLTGGDRKIGEITRRQISDYVADQRRKGPLIGPRWRNQLRSAVVSSKIPYEKNSIRHSFCSYALAAGWPLVEVVQMMGHGGSPTMVFSHYRNVVSEEDGKRWFAIVP